MPRLTADCENDGAGRDCNGAQFYQSRHIVFALRENVAGNLLYSVPNKLSSLLVARNPRGRIADAKVTLHSIVCERLSSLGAPIEVQSEQALTDAASGGPSSSQSAGLPGAGLPCDGLTTSRGSALPQYRVEFRDGTEDGQVVFLDGSSVIALPANHVNVQMFTPSTEFELDPTPGTQLQSPGPYVDAIASASVAWRCEAGGDSAPSGMATFTQNQNTVVPAELPPNIMLFERPPFAKRVVLIPPIGTPVLYSFMASPSVVLVTPPPLANVIQQPQDIPAGTTHIAVFPSPGTISGLTVSVIWEIGVR